MITVKNLSKSFGKLKALDNINIQFHTGQAVSFIGPNASGKTTFIKCLLGMVIPNSGEIVVKGRNIANDFAYRNDIGYMPQIGRYPDNMTIGQIFEMMKDIRGGNSRQAIGDRQQETGDRLDEELITLFGLKTMFSKQMRTLSGGTRQKVSAALAFLFDPSVLILDEPTAGLDPVASEILKAKILKEKQRGKLILITSHILSDMDEIASDVLYLIEGKVQFFKSVQQLKSETCEQKLEKVIARVMAPQY
jgi:Cu-processing system ATP-binding protein